MKKAHFYSCFLLVSILGAARLSLPISGVHFKLSFLLLALFFLLRVANNKIYYSVTELLLFFVMFGGALISLPNSIKESVSFFYLFWLSFDFFIVYSFFKSISYEFGFEFIKKVYTYSFRFQIAFSAFLFPFFHTDDSRYSFFYYEPSYFAIASIPYVGFFFHDLFISGIKKVWGDVIWILIFIFVTKSANLMLIMVLFCLCFFFLKKSRSILYKIKFLVTSFVFGCIFVFLFVYVMSKNIVGNTLLKIFSSPDVMVALLARSGNRWPRVELVLDVIRNVFPSGVGLGNYKYFTQSFLPSTDYSNGVAYLDPVGLPAVNIYMEALVEFGLIGFLGFLFFNIFVFKKSIYKEGLNNKYELFIILLVFMLSLSIESSYLKISLWAFWGCVIGIVAHKRKRE